MGMKPSRGLFAPGLGSVLVRAVAAVFLASLCSHAQENQSSVTFSVAAHPKDRRWVLAMGFLPEGQSGPIRLRDKGTGKEVPCQVYGNNVWWLIPSIAGGTRMMYTAEKGEPEKAASLRLVEDANGTISFQAPDREITRFYPSAGTANKKPCFYPLVGHGVNVLRGYPLEERPGEARDHPHQTGIFHAFGDVNGKDYWSKVPITHMKFISKQAGPVFARIVSMNKWGDDLIETYDVRVLNAGPDIVMDWFITLMTLEKPVVLGRDQRMAKEGSFAVRVGAELSKKGDAPDMMSDSLGNKGEKAIRAQAAPWVDYVGDFGGNKVGVSVMNHPSSFRYPGTWHVRAYGLFAANPWYTAEAKALGRTGEFTVTKDEPISLGYRVYVHAGDAAKGNVADVFEGYVHANVE